MKRVGIYIVLLSICSGVWAAERSAEEALQIASQLVHERVASGARRAPARGVTSELVGRGASYYAVKTGEGFVLVGADDRLHEVLGYADEGEFDTTNENLMYWLGCYDEELANVDENEDVDDNDDDNENGNGVGRRVQSFSDALEPLMKSKWGQTAPYNDKCPYYDVEKKSPAGCVATAMAQIMYYHKAPAMGIGSHSYYWINKDGSNPSKTLMADFGATTYKWSQMLDEYKSGEYSEEQTDIISTLLFHCAVSVNMSFGDGSGAYTDDVPAALENYFGYDSHYQKVPKTLYSPDSLNQIIRKELRAGRPILVSGQNDEGGHAFVCDGYNRMAYFHINWGWNGRSDGYFLLSALNPSSQGIGGTTKGYNTGATFYVGLQPKKSGATRLPSQMGADSIATNKLRYSRNETMTTSIYKLQNFGMDNFSGEYGIALYQEDKDELVTIVKSTTYSLLANHYRTTTANLSGAIPSSVKVGTYRLCGVYRETGEQWKRLLCRYDDYYRTVYISASSVEVMDNNAPAVLALVEKISIPQADAVPYSGVPVAFSIKNTGGTFRGQISARIYDDGIAAGQYELLDSLTIRRGETYASALQQSFSYSLEPGVPYTMRLCWRKDKNSKWTNFTPAAYGEVEFTINHPEPLLSLLTPISFPDNSMVPQAGAPLSYSLYNRGKDLDGELRICFKEQGITRGYVEGEMVQIATGETLSGTIDKPFPSMSAGTMKAMLQFRQKGDDTWYLADDSIRSVVTFTLYEDHPTKLQEVMPDETVDVYDVMGRNVPSEIYLPAGVYILRDRQSGIITKKYRY